MVMCEKEVWTHVPCTKHQLPDVRTAPCIYEGNTILQQKTALFHVRTCVDVGFRLHRSLQYRTRSQTRAQLLRQRISRPHRAHVLASLSERPLMEAGVEPKSRFERVWRHALGGPPLGR